MIQPVIILSAVLSAMIAVCAVAKPAKEKPDKPDKPEKPKVEIGAKKIKEPDQDGKPSREFSVMFDIASRARNRRERNGKEPGRK